MPGIQDPGPSGIAAPNPAALVQPVQPVATPDAVTTMINAFRAGQISAQDIIDRAGELGQAKQKAALVEAKFAASPEVLEARKQAALATAAKAKMEVETADLTKITQENKLKHENAVAMLGVNGPKIDAAYTSIGKLIPMKESATMPGVSIPDIDAIEQELPKITQFANVRAKQAALDAAWQPHKVTFKDAQGKSVTAEGWVNAISGETSSVKPLPKAITYDNWLQSLKPGAIQVAPAVSATPAIPTTPIAPAPVHTEAEINAARARIAEAGMDVVEATKLPVAQLFPQTPVSKPVVQPVAAVPVVQPAAAPSPLAGTPYEGWRISETTEAPQEQKQQMVNNAAMRYQANLVVQGLQNAKQAYDAAQDVIQAIKPDGSYSPALKSTPKQADYKLMVNYAKILDPNSVVREGEITLLQGTSSAWQNVANAIKDKTFSDYVNKLLGKQIFTGQERVGMKSLLVGSFENRIASAKEIRENSAKALRDIGASENQINAALPMPAYSTTPGAASAAGPARQTKTIAGGLVMEEGADGVWRVKP